jgi:hypothetical protein
MVPDATALRAGASQTRIFSRREKFFAGGAPTVSALISRPRAGPGPGEKSQDRKTTICHIDIRFADKPRSLPGSERARKCPHEKTAPAPIRTMYFGECIMETRKFVVEVLWLFLGMGTCPIDMVLDPQSGALNTAPSQLFHPQTKTTNSFSTNRWYCPSYVRPPPFGR